MVVTITCNPAIDKTVYEDKTVFDIGGKGINVSKVLKEFGINSIATGFIGKDNKDLVINDLNNNNIENHFIEVDGKVRTNTKRIINNSLIEENEDGPIISENNTKQLKDYISTFKEDIIVISGSTPSCVSKELYKDLISILKENNNYVILDSSGDLLKNAIYAKPDLIKPNKDEICELFDIEYDENVVINKCKELGIDVCLSLGEEGAIFIYKDVYKIKTIKIDYKSSVGAGDAMVAALVYAKLNKLDVKDTVKMAMAAALAACETEGTKPPKYGDILSKYNSLLY